MPKVAAYELLDSDSDAALERYDKNRTSPANLCLFLGRVEFSGFGEDFEDAIGEAIEEAARGIVGNIAAVHLQDVLGGR